MAKYLGFRGKALAAAQIWILIMPAYILFGFNNGVAGGLLSMPSFVKQFPRIDTANTTGDLKTHNSRIQGTVVALYTLGAFFGSLSCIWIGGPLGRKRTIMLGASINIVGAIIQSSSFSLAQLIVGRLVSGLGFGALAATAPNWQSECSNAAHRGEAVLFESLFISGGLAISGWVNFGMSHVKSSASWRFPLALPILFCVMVITGIQFMPESPRWLVQNGRVQEAREVLAVLDDVPEDHETVSDSIREMEYSLALAGETRFRDVLRNGKDRFFHRTLLACTVTCFQQMCGINALGFYQTDIFHTDLGLSTETARVVAASVFTWQTLCSPIGILTVDRFGRRKLMLISAFGMGTCMAVIAGTSSQGGNLKAVGAAGAFIFLYSLFFPIGFLGMAFLYAAEIAPLSARTHITALSTGSAWLFNFIVAEVTPVGFATIHYRYYIVYACINFFLIMPVVYFIFPNTTGMHLEQIDNIFLGSNNVFDPVKVARRIGKETDIHMDEVEKSAAFAKGDLGAGGSEHI